MELALEEGQAWEPHMAAVWVELLLQAHLWGLLLSGLCMVLLEALLPLNRYLCTLLRYLNML